MKRSEFLVRKMDCAAEENIVRLKLSDIREIQSLDFDISNKRLTVIHSGNLEEISKAIHSLNFNATLLGTEDAVESNMRPENARLQSTLLWKVLIINFTFFIVEMITGLFSRSMGLIADSLDMLADAIVYGMSLFAVSGSVNRKKKVARVSGYFQLVLALTGFTEVLRRFLGYEVLPDFRVMILVSVLALIANTICLYLLQKSRSNEAHMKASMIFTSNDIIINIGVIIAGALVFLLDSKYPDLLIGAVVFVLVTKGAITILKLSKPEK